MKYDVLILARLGEITLKGLNRRKFENRLMRTMRSRLKAFGEFTVFQSHSRIWIEALDLSAKENMDEALHVATTVFGLVSASPVRRYEAELTEDNLLAIAKSYAQEARLQLEGKSFKVETKRGNKQFPWDSMEISREVGAVLLEEVEGLTVDVHNPDVVVYVDVRDRFSFYSEIVPGLKGLPVGSSGKAMVLLSGGIDSPVAAYMMAGRGIELEAIYFHTFPYTSDRAKEKVIDLARLVAQYSGPIKLHVVDFTDIQMELRAKCPDDMMTIVMRRMMYRIAEEFAAKRGCTALITGESLGQVASQTTEALACTDAVTTLPVFRPLIGVDKDETIQIARRIGTFETSILPYEDCCTVFVAKHPRTRPSLKHAEIAEEQLDVDALTADGLAKIETHKLSYDMDRMYN